MKERLSPVMGGSPKQHSTAPSHGKLHQPAHSDAEQNPVSSEYSGWPSRQLRWCVSALARSCVCLHMSSVADASLCNHAGCCGAQQWHGCFWL